MATTPSLAADSVNLVSNTTASIISGSVVNGNITSYSSVLNSLANNGGAINCIVNIDEFLFDGGVVSGDVNRLSEIENLLVSNGAFSANDIRNKLTAVIGSAILGNLTDISRVFAAGRPHVL